MSAVYSARFAAGDLALSAGGITYTVPAGMVAIVRDFSGYVVPPTGGSSLVQLAVAAEDSTGYYLYAVQLNAPTSFQWTGRQVLTEGDQIFAGCTSGSGSGAVSGYLLHGAPA